MALLAGSLNPNMSPVTRLVMLNMLVAETEGRGNRRLKKIYRPHLEQWEKDIELPYADWTAGGFCWTRGELREATRQAREILDLPQDT